MKRATRFIMILSAVVFIAALGALREEARILPSAGAESARVWTGDPQAVAFAIPSKLPAPIPPRPTAKPDEQTATEVARTDAPAATAAPESWPETDDPVVLSYREMTAIYPDLIGWLKIDGTAIDSPVMRSPDEAGRYPHMLPTNDPSIPNENTIIYARSMHDGSMFDELSVYETRAGYEAHPYIQFDTLYGRGLYRVIAVFRTSVGAEDEFRYDDYGWLDDQETFDLYMRGVTTNQLYDTGETAEYGDQLLSLSTCDYNEPNGRFIVVARRITETAKTLDN